MIDAVHSNANVCLCLLDNSITAMTGHQGNAGTARDIKGNLAARIDIMRMIYATGIPADRVRLVDPLDVKGMDAAIEEALAVEGLFIIVTKRPCVLLKEVARQNQNKYCVVDAEKCLGCKACMRAACPALAFADGKAVIVDPAGCTACGLCAQLCRADAISKVGE